MLGFLLLWRVLIPLEQYVQRQSLPVPAFSQTGNGQVSSKGLQSDDAVLIRKSDGQILMDKNADQKIYPALFSFLVAKSLQPHGRTATGGFFLRC